MLKYIILGLFGWFLVISVFFLNVTLLFEFAHLSLYISCISVQSAYGWKLCIFCSVFYWFNILKNVI